MTYKPETYNPMTPSHFQMIKICTKKKVEERGGTIPETTVWRKDCHSHSKYKEWRTTGWVSGLQNPVESETSLVVASSEGQDPRPFVRNRLWILGVLW